MVRAELVTAIILTDTGEGERNSAENVNQHRTGTLRHFTLSDWSAWR